MQPKSSLSPEATLGILNAHYINCVGFWSQTDPTYKPTGYTDDEVTAMSLHDIFICHHNPFSPNGECLDEIAHERYLAEGGWHSHYKAVWTNIMNELARHYSQSSDTASRDNAWQAISYGVMAVHGHAIWQFYAEGATVSGTTMSEWFGEYFHYRFPYIESAIRRHISSCGINADGSFSYTIHHHLPNIT